MSDELIPEKIEVAPAVPTGRWVVLAILSFGVLMVGALWAYWELYTRPFRPLQYAIAEQFPDSSPRVIGGKHKSHKQGNPSVLRMIVQIPLKEFDPTRNRQRSERRALELARIAERLHVLDKYEELEIYLIQRIPERSERRWKVSRSIVDWRSLLSGTVSSTTQPRHGA